MKIPLRDTWSIRPRGLKDSNIQPDPETCLHAFSSYYERGLIDTALDESGHFRLAGVHSHTHFENASHKHKNAS